MLRELLETEHELVHTRYRISHENRGTIGQTVYVFSDFILLDSDLCVWGGSRKNTRYIDDLVRERFPIEMRMSLWLGPHSWRFAGLVTLLLRACVVAS